MTPPSAPVRVGVYTRKSTDENLDIQFNSLEAQREAIESYVESRKGDRWQVVSPSCDDGGFSGSTMSRPALQRLLKDVEAKKIDVVAVYKLDRLSRDRLDIFQIVKFLERSGVEFVSVTERFEATSTGQAFLGMTSVFAQLERDRIAERTRDKMAATRRRGQWTGGRPVLGYDLVDKRLVVNPEEALQVQAIFQLYLDLRSLGRVARELNERGWTTKAYRTKSGRVNPGRPFDKTRVRHILGRPMYLGVVEYKGERYQGQHEPIVENETWEAVQKMLGEQRGTGPARRSKWEPPLAGLLRCGVCGSSMPLHHTAKGPRRYRYYVCSRYMKVGADACPGSRVSAPNIENFVIARIRSIGQDPELLRETFAAARASHEKQEPDLLAETRRLSSEQKRLEHERRNLVDSIAKDGDPGGSLADRFREVEADLRTAMGRSKVAREEFAALREHTLDESDLRAALAGFDPVWHELFPRERALSCVPK